MMLVEERTVGDLGKLMMKFSSLYTESGVYPLQQIIDWTMVDSGRSLRRPMHLHRYHYENPLNLEIY
jgi:hypothetical protein